jgi:hypothetical protein
MSQSLLRFQCVRYGLQIVAALVLVGCGETTVHGDPPPDGSDPPVIIYGVPPDMCGEGFESAGDGGCVAVLPPETCGDGTFAIPGETSCHEVARCMDGTWGDIPIDALTEHVDGSYMGNDSDGTAARPWPLVADAVAAADVGAVVAIADGSYVEDLLITKPVTLWGRCPASVELVGVGTEIATVFIRNGGSSAVLRDLAITGPRSGVILSGVSDVLFDRLWIHDTGSRGVNAEATLGSTLFVLSRSLVERAQEIGVMANGATAFVEGSVVRDTQPFTQTQGRGLGISVQYQVDEDARGNADIVSSIVESSRGVGVFVGGSDAMLEDTLVRDTLPQESGDLYGEGISVEVEPNSGVTASATIRRTVFERNQAISVVVLGASASLEHTTIRDTAPQLANAFFGHGVHSQVGISSGIAGTLTLRDSAVLNSFAMGVLVAGGTGDIQRSLISGSAPDAVSGEFGDGISVISFQLPTSATISDSRIEGAARAGISLFGSEVMLSASELSCNAIQLAADPYDTLQPNLQNLGANVCGCEETTAPCKALSAGLTPPTPIDGF